MDSALIRSILTDLSDRYPVDLRTYARQEIDRQLFHVSTVVSLAPKGDLTDIGGGLGMFSAACATLGMRPHVIDDFADHGSRLYVTELHQLHQARGVTVLSRDVIEAGLGLPANSMDVITSFDSMEHWHHSPKQLFREVVAALRPGGWFILGVPNCVNLRKRMSVMLGNGKWSSMDTWYEQPRFRGHVREPDVDDLHYLAKDMSLIDVRTMGRNWQGYCNTRPWVRRVTPLVDHFLRLRPSLCSDLYLLGRRPD